jgi:O-antigen/teichoic acid export membrane protein
VGFGVWALVGQSIIRTILYNIVLWYGSKWKPTIVFSMTSFRELFGFGSKLLLAGSVAIVVNNMYSILIGKFFSSKEVGYYTRGIQYTDLVSSTVTSILQSVTFPILSSVQADRERMIRIYKRIFRSTAFFIFPTMTLFALLSEPFVRFLLTEKWIPIVPLLQWLCFAKLVTPISSLNLNILNAMGRSDLFLKIDLSKVPMVLIALVVTVPYGINVVVIGNFITTFIAFFFNAYYPGKLLNFGATKQIKEMKSIFFATIGMGILVYLTIQFFETDLLKLIIGGIVGIISYFSIALLMKIPETKELKEINKKIKL